MIKSAFIRVVSITGLPEFIRSLGGEPETLMEEVGINPDILQKGDGIFSFSKGVMLYELAARVLEEPNFGLKRALACPPHFNNFGPVVYLGLFEKTARSWVHAMHNFQHLYTDGQAISLHEEPENGIGIIRLSPIGYSVHPRQYTEMQMAAFSLLAESVLKTPDAKPQITRFRHQRPESTDLHEEIFGGVLEFGAEHDEFVFDIKLLDTKLRGPANFLKSLVNLYMQYRMRNLPQFDMSTKETLELYLQSVIGAGRCSLEVAAEALVLSPKKLQRQLAEDGTNFSSVLDGVRRKLAVSMLRNPDLKIKIIAGMLDYATTQAFNLAFNRWTGMSPVAYRKVLIENNEMYDPL
jgi:AraC-like DNA-binding protein